MLVRRKKWLAGAVLCAIGLGGPLAIAARNVWRVEEGLHPPRVAITAPLPPHAQPVRFRAKDGPMLHGWFVPSGNGATIILAHGHAQNRAQLLPEAAILVEAGFGVLLFDWRAHGESEGDFTSWGWLEQEDLAAALGFLSQHPKVDPFRLGALGFSRGGTVSLEVAARDSRIRAVVAASTSTSLREALARDFGSGPLAVLPTRLVFALHGVDIDSVRPIEKICAVSPRSVLIIHGAADEATPVENGRRFWNAACAPSEYWEVPGAGHGNFELAAPAEYGPRLVRFFQTSLLDR